MSTFHSWFKGDWLEFPLRIILAVGLLCMACSMLKYILSSPTYSRTFPMKTWWSFSKPCYVEMTIFYLVSLLTLNIGPTLHFQDKLNLTILDALLTCAWVQFVSILLRIFLCLFHNGYKAIVCVWYKAIVCVCVCVCVWIGY